MPPTPSIRSFKAPSPLNTRCADAAVILERAHDSVAALLKFRHSARAQRGRPRGISTDEEQDLLRAMLVMAAAGVDATLKQLIRDTMSILVTSNEVRDGLEKFVSRQISREGEEPRGRSAAFLARTLTETAPWQFLMSEYIDHLTSGSLQSADELAKVARVLALDAKLIEKKKLDPIFDARNKILHELDISLERDRRRRNHRGLADMVGWTNTLLAVAESILAAINGKLP